MFWFDEIFTVAVSQLPDIASIWSACKGGADLNPPLFYLLTRWSQDLFGMTELGARVPEIIGFWVFCLCIYRFVAMRAGALSGFIALLFPLTTASYWYASDARPHGIVLGFFGLALVSWQLAATSSKQRWAPVALLGASLTAAALCHCYAFILFIPLGLGELARTVKRRRIDVWIWLSLILPAVVSVLTVLPLLSTVQGVYLPTPIGPLLGHLWRGWDLAFEPHIAFAILIILVVPVVIQWRSAEVVSSSDSAVSVRIPSHEIAALAGLLCTPFFVFIAAWITHAPVFGRYSLIATGGVACLVAFATARSNLTGVLVLSLIVVGIGGEALHFRHGYFVVEPSTNLEISTRPDEWNASLARMAKAAEGEDPIVILNNLAFAPGFYYAPAALRSRLFNLTPDFNGEGYRQLQHFAPVPGNISARSEFMLAHKTFYAYGRVAEADIFRQLGGQLTVQDCPSQDCLFRVVVPSILPLPLGPPQQPTQK